MTEWSYSFWKFTENEKILFHYLPPNRSNPGWCHDVEKLILMSEYFLNVTHLRWFSFLQKPVACLLQVFDFDLQAKLFGVTQWVAIILLGLLRRRFGHWIKINLAKHCFNEPVEMLVCLFAWHFVVKSNINTTMRKQVIVNRNRYLMPIWEVNRYINFIHLYDLMQDRYFSENTIRTLDSQINGGRFIIFISKIDSPGLVWTPLNPPLNLKFEECLIWNPLFFLFRFNVILASRSFEQLRLTFDKYEEVNIIFLPRSLFWRFFGDGGAIALPGRRTIIWSDEYNLI